MQSLGLSMLGKGQYRIDIVSAELWWQGEFALRTL